VYYTGNLDITDHCRTITKCETAAPFADAHPKPNCSANSGSTVDTTEMEELILAFLPRSPAYSVNFCLQISALD